MYYRQATGTDLEKIKSLLDSCKLPSADCEEHINNYFIVEDKRDIIGVGGLEIMDSLGLIRSLAVKPEYRGQGVATKLYCLLEKRASDAGITTLYLLTESASRFFSRFGFEIQNNAKPPRAIANTKQFSRLCPSTAVLMIHSLDQQNI